MSSDIQANPIKVLELLEKSLFNSEIPCQGHDCRARVLNGRGTTIVSVPRFRASLTLACSYARQA